MGLFRITWDYSGQLRTNQNHMRTIGTIYINSGLKETKLKGDQSGTNRTNWNHYTKLRPTPRARSDNTGPYRTKQNQTR